MIWRFSLLYTFWQSLFETPSTLTFNLTFDADTFSVFPEIDSIFQWTFWKLSKEFLTPSSHTQSLLHKVIILETRFARQADRLDVVGVRDSLRQSQQRNVVVLVGGLRIIILMWNQLLDGNVKWWSIADNTVNELIIAVGVGRRVPFAESNAGQRPRRRQIFSVDAMRSWNESLRLTLHAMASAGWPVMTCKFFR